MISDTLQQSTLKIEYKWNIITNHYQKSLRSPLFLIEVLVLKNGTIHITRFSRLQLIPFN